MPDDYINDKAIEKFTSEYYGFDYEQEDINDDIDSNHNDDEEKPFDAEKIRIDQQMLSLKYIFELMESGLLDIAPDFQRKSVWKENKRKSLLIESLMLKIPIPAFYFYENRISQFQVIDGQQRLMTIRDFLNNEFRLSGLEYLGEDYNKKTFDELDVKYQQRIFRTQLAVNILDARSPKKVIYDIFRRVNTGGISLNPQEMRNAICEKRVRDFLRKASNSKEYLQATRNRIKDDRMDSQEMVVRFYAFYKAYDYDNKKIKYNYPNLVTMFDDAIEELNELSRFELDRLYRIFLEAMDRAYSLFGEYCFSKVFINSEEGLYRNLDIINKSLFSSFSVILADNKFDSVDLKNYRSSALKILANSLKIDDYFNAITIGTGDRKRIELNFSYSNEVIEKCQFLI